MLVELEGDAPEDEPEDHQGDWNVQRMQGDGIHQRKGAEQRTAEHHQPGLVGVPDTAEAGHHGAATFLVTRQQGKNANAEIEAVQHHIQHQDQPDDEKPDVAQKQLHLVHG